MSRRGLYELPGGRPMLVRTLLTLVNFATIAAAIGVLLAFPQYAGWAFYMLLGWMFVSLALIYNPRTNRPIGAGAPPPGAGPAGSPLVSTTSPPSSSGIGFCIYCAAPVDPGTVRCPACGHALPHFS